MARAFNGSSDTIAISSFPVAGSTVAYSIAAWIRPTSVSVIHSILGMDDGSPHRFLQFRVSASAKLDLIQFTSASAATTLSSLTSITSNTWTHVGGSCPGTNNSGTSKVFVGGVLDNSATSKAGQTVNAIGHADIGSRHGGDFFPGAIGYVAYWSAQIPDGCFSSMAAGASPLLFGPDHFWPLWGVDSPEPDLGVASHVTGTLTGTTQATIHQPVAMPILSL